MGAVFKDFLMIFYHFRFKKRCDLNSKSGGSDFYISDIGGIIFGIWKIFGFD